MGHGKTLFKLAHVLKGVQARVCYPVLHHLLPFTSSNIDTIGCSFVIPLLFLCAVVFKIVAKKHTHIIHLPSNFQVCSTVLSATCTLLCCRSPGQLTVPRIPHCWICPPKRRSPPSSSYLTFCPVNLATSVPHVCEIIQDLSLFDWFISFTIMSSRVKILMPSCSSGTVLSTWGCFLFLHIHSQYLVHVMVFVL